MSPPVRFKKYANRRLYNLSESRHMTLAEMAELIRGGSDIEVVDARTREDVTAFILTQIILEQAKNRDTLLPVALLHMIIRYGDNVLVDFFQNHLQQVIGSYLEYREAMDGQFRRWLELGTDFTAAARKGMKDMNPFRAYFGAGDEDGDEEGGGQP